MNSTRFWAAAALLSLVTCAYAELRISEICPKPNSYDSQNRSPGWIEFYNDGAEAVDLADYELVRANRGKAAAPGDASKNFVSRTVPAGGYTVVYTTEDWPNANSGVVAVYQESAYGSMMVFPSKINNKKYPLVQLYKGTDAATKVLVDQVIVPVDLPETMSIAPVGSPFAAFSGADPDEYTVISDASAVKFAMLPTTTKGAANNYTGAIPVGPNAGPLYGIAHKLSDWQAFPAPVAGQDYAISLAVNPLTAAAGDAISSVTLLYRCGTGPTNTLAMAQGAYGSPTGQLWTASIPAAALPAAGQPVRWAAVVTDAAGNTWRTPSFRDKQLSYGWYGTMMPAASLESATLQTFHLFVEGNSVAQMDVDADDQNLSLVPYNARCDVFDSSTGYYYDNVRIDLRGNTTASFRKKSHGLRFNKSQPLTCTDPVTGTKVKEIRKTSFIAEYSDPALVRQALSYKVFRDAGLDVPFDYPVRLNLNGQFYQLAWHSNRFTDELIEDYYGYDPFGYSFKSVGDLAGTSTAGSKKKVTPDNDNENDFSVLNQFQNLISGVSAVSESFTGDGMDSEIPAITKTVVQKFDLPAWINYLAAARITHECDDIWANLCVYWDVNGTDTWKPLAYDLNQSWGVYYVEAGYTDRSGVIVTNDHFKSHPLFGGLRIRTHQKNSTDCFKTGGRGFECVYQSPKFRRLYLRRLRTLMDEQLKAPGTAKANTPFWSYVTMLQNACSAEDLLDNSKWGYGTGTVIYVWPNQMELQQGIDDLWNNYVVPRRQHLFVTHSVTNTAKTIGYGEHLNAGIPLPQSPIATLAQNFSFDNLDDEGVLEGDALVIRNGNAEAVDMSGWTLSGTMNYAFPAGTVVDANDTIIVVADRKDYVADNTASLTDQVIVGNARHNPAVLTLALLSADGTPVAESGPAVRTDNYRYLRLHSFDGVTTNAGGDTTEWIVLTNLSDSVALNLADVHLVFCKTGDAVAKCDFTIASGTIPAGGSIRLDQADYASSGWSKITNGNLDIAIYDEANDTVQSGKVAQGDFAAYKNKPGEDPATAKYLVLNSTAHNFVSTDFSEEYYFEQPEPEPPPPPVLGQYRAPFTVTGYTGASALADFPVLVRLANNSPEGFNYNDCAANGADLRFADANGEQIPCEIDTWDASGESLVWVRLPVMTTNTIFTMWYGGEGTDNYATNVWSRYVGVWHMDEALGTVADATGHGLAATPMGNTANSVALANGAVGNARQTATSAAKGYLSIPNYNGFGLGDTFTMSGWIKLTAVTAYPRLFSRKNNYTDANGWEIEMSNGSLANFAARGANNPSYTGTFSPALNTAWSHVVLAYNGATLTVYQNGAQIKTGAINAATDNGLPLSIGCDSDGSETYAQGAFDECRLMGGAATADWIKAEYDQVANASFLTAGTVVLAETPQISTSTLLQDVDTFVVSAMLNATGEGAESCDLYFAYGLAGDPLPAYELVRSGLAVGATVSRTLSGLEEGQTYAYSFLASNTLDKVTVKGGTFFAGIDFKRPDKNVAEFVRGVKFTVTGYTGTDVLTNFPVLVRLSANSPRGFSYADFYNPGDVPGADLCFLDAAGNGIPHEIDTWNTSGESLVWVTLPTMVNGTEFSMWYRSSKNGSVVCAANAWADYTGVWHLGEGGDGVQSVADSTTNALTGVTHANSLAVSAGRIGAARRNSTKSGNAAANGRILVSLGAADSRERAVVDALVPEFSASLWFNPQANADWSYLIARKGDDAMEGWGIQFGHNTDFQPVRIWASLGKNDAAYYRTFSPNAPYNTKANMNLVAWRQVHIVFGSDGYVDFYYDGGAYHTRQQVPLCGKNFDTNLNEILARNGDADLAFGGMSASGYGAFNGEMDEVRIRKGKDSADWVQAEYDAVVNAGFLNGGEVVSFAETPRPIATFTLADSSAKYVQFSGSIGNCGGEATACDFFAKVWKTAESEPETWTNLVSDIAAGVPFSAVIVGLDPETAYSYKLKAVNNLETPYDSEIAEGTFTTGGTGGGGEGGVRARIGNDYVHTFVIDPAVGETTFTFTPPDYISSIKALVVAGGGPGGYQRGGGGGAGGLIYDEALAVTGGATYTVNVGTGGVAAASAASYGVNGGVSSIYLGAVEIIAATGGGAGGNGATVTAGVAGGSGGGGGGIASTTHAAGGAGVSGQGNGGGVSGNYNSNYVAGGGGGAGRAGGAAANDSPPSGGSGGQGFLTDISGTPTWYAGGGGGGGKQAGSTTNLGSPGGGGDGGGGRGGMDVPSGTVNPSFDPKAVAGTDGRGGGGGGGSDVSGFYQGANGGNGIVIVRYTVHGSGAGSDEPVVSLTEAQYDGDLVISGSYRVAWAGEGADGADVFVKWGYSPNGLSHAVRVATDKVGLGTFAINIPVDQTTIYLRVAAENGQYEGVSDELFAIYIPEYDGEVPGDNTIPLLGNVSVSHIDGIFARLTGTVTSFGEAGEGEDPIDGCVVSAYVGTSADPARMTKLGELPVTAGEPFSYAITNLVPAIEYYWYLEAKNSAGHAVATDVGSFTTVEASLFNTCSASADQQTFTLSGTLLQIGAGTTYVFVRWNDGSWHDWTLVKTFTTDSADLSFNSAGFRRETWGNVSWEAMCSNECATATGETTGTYWIDTRSGSANASDTATYTWQDVDGEWSGNWNDPAHWSCNKADNLGYPNNANTPASFANCTLEHPVVVTVNGKYACGAFRCVGNAASDITFAGNGVSSSQISCGQLPEKTVESGTRLVFRDLTLTRASGGDAWLIANTEAVKTNLLFRFSNVTSTGIGSTTFGAPYSRFEIVNGSSVTLSGKFSPGGQDTVLLIDDSSFTVGHIYAPADGAGSMAIAFRGASPLLTSSGNLGTWNNSEDLRLVFTVPKGGYATAPVQHTSTDKLFAWNASTSASGIYSKYILEIDPKSPALYDQKNQIVDNVLVTTAFGFEFANMVEGIGNVPRHGGQPVGAFKYGVDGVPLEDGAALSMARQILLDLRGFPPPTVLFLK